MHDNQVLVLTDCTEYRQALQARPPRVVHGGAALLLTLVAAAVAWAALTEADVVVRAPGLVRPVAAPHPVKTRFGGRVEKVFVREGQRVGKGDLLVQLDTEKVRSEIAKREATVRAGAEELAKVDALLAALPDRFGAETATRKAKLDQAVEDAELKRRRRDEDIRQAQGELRCAEADEGRARQAFGRGVGSKADVDKTAAQTEAAGAKLASAKLPVAEGEADARRKELAELDHSHAAERGNLEKERAAKRGQVATVEEELKNLRWEVDQAGVRAPVAGVVVSPDPKEGELLEPGKVVAEVAEEDGFRFEAQVPTEEVGHLRPGMPVLVKLDAYDYQRYGTAAGTVCFVAEDSRVVEGRAVYTVRVELAGAEVGRGDLRGRVRLGMAGRAEVVTDRRSVLALLVKKVRQTISLG